LVPWPLLSRPHAPAVALLLQVSWQRLGESLSDTPRRSADPDGVSFARASSSPKKETRRWQDVPPAEWSVELVRMWAVAALGPGRGLGGDILGAGLDASMVDGEALLAVPSFSTLHGAVGRDVPAGPVLRLWGKLQQLQLEAGVANTPEAAKRLQRTQAFFIPLLLASPVC